MSREIDHSGLGSSYLRTYPDVPITHEEGAACAYCAALAAPSTEPALDVERTRTLAVLLHEMRLCRTQPEQHTARGHEPDAERILARLAESQP